jgi:hypothetical protein
MNGTRIYVFRRKALEAEAKANRPNIDEPTPRAWLIVARDRSKIAVRGFFAGVVRKKLGFTLESEKLDGSARVYRIATSKSDKLGKRKNKTNSPDRQVA